MFHFKCKDIYGNVFSATVTGYRSGYWAWRKVVSTIDYAVKISLV